MASLQYKYSHACSYPSTQLLRMASIPDQLTTTSASTWDAEHCQVPNTGRSMATDAHDEQYMYRLRRKFNRETQDTFTAFAYSTTWTRNTKPTNAELSIVHSKQTWDSQVVTLRGQWTVLLTIAGGREKTIRACRPSSSEVLRIQFFRGYSFAVKFDLINAKTKQKARTETNTILHTNLLSVEFNRQCASVLQSIHELTVTVGAAASYQIDH
jgi:hypothetical protein